MPFQLTFSDQNSSSANDLKRKTTLTFEQAPVVAGAKECPVPGIDKPVFKILANEDKTYAIEPLRDSDIRLNGSPIKEKTNLKSGDEILCPPAIVKFYTVRPRAKQSWQSALLTFAAKVAIAVFLAVQVTVMFWLPWQLSTSSIWDGAAAKQKITQKLETTRKRVSALLKQKDLDKADALTQLLVAQVALDVEQRSLYLRKHEDQMSRSQRRNMVEDLDKLNAILDDVESKKPFPEIPKPDIDAAVKAILHK